MVKLVAWGPGGLDSERIPENERDCYTPKVEHATVKLARDLTRPKFPPN